MTLREIKGSDVRIYEDHQQFSRGEWALMLGIHSTTFGDAVRRGGATDFIGGDKDFPRRRYTFTKVAEFPKIVAAIGSRKPRSGHTPWATGVDTSQDFAVTAPSGSTFVYEYPKTVSGINFFPARFGYLNKLIEAALRIRRD